jgi:hypothetical protein
MIMLRGMKGGERLGRIHFVCHEHGRSCQGRSVPFRQVHCAGECGPSVMYEILGSLHE